MKSAIDTDVLLKRIQKEKRTKPDGSVSFESSAIISIELLASILEFEDEIPQSSRFDLVHRAIRALVLKGDLSQRNLFNSLSRLQREYLDTPLNPFVTVTAISITSERTSFSRIVNGIKLDFSRFLPRRFDLQATVEVAKRDGLAETPPDYWWVRANVSARSHWEAYRTGIDAIDYLRGVWNFVINWPSYSILRTGPPEPINRIVKGPMQAIHHPDGSVSPGGYWYDSLNAFRRLRRAYDVDRKLSTIVRSERIMRGEISRSPYRRDCEIWIRDFSRALDNADLSLSFLDMWRVLEHVTGTKKASFETTVKRGSRFFFKDQDYFRMILNVMREVRNGAIHAGSNEKLDNAHVTELKFVLETIIRFMIRNPLRFRSLEDAYSFMEISSDLDLLRDQLRVRSRALNLQLQADRRRGKTTR